MHLKPQRGAMAGFSLAELMVASAIGLIVIGAVITLVLSMMRSNQETLQSTRLNQELRSTMAVIASEIQRARGIQDPIAAVGKSGGIDYNNDGVVDAVDVDFPNILIESGNDCARYAYYDGSAVVYRAIYLSGDRIGMDSGSTRGDATCGGGAPITTAGDIRITELDFAYDPSPTGTGKRWFSISLQGELAASSTAVRPKTTRRVVSIRSNDS